MSMVSLILPQAIYTLRASHEVNFIDLGRYQSVVNIFKLIKCLELFPQNLVQKLFREYIERYGKIIKKSSICSRSSTKKSGAIKHTK